MSSENIEALRQKADNAQENATNLVAFDLRVLARFRDEGPYVQILSDTGAARLVLFCFKPGQQLKEHRTSSQIMIQVVRGRIAFAANEQAITVSAGTLLQLEANVPHSITAQTTAVVLVTMTPSPAQHSLEHDVFEKLTPLVMRSE